MKKPLTMLSIVLLLSLALFSCKDRAKEAADMAAKIAAAQEQARTEAKQAARIAKLEADAEVNSRNAADALAKAAEQSRRAEADRQQADLERRAADAQRALDAATARGDKNAADLRRQMAEMKAALASSNAAAEKARSDAANAAAQRRLADAARDRKIAADLERIRKNRAAGTGGGGGILPAGGSALVGPKGKLVEAADGSSIFVPPGALRSPQNVSVTPYPAPKGGGYAIVCKPAGKHWGNTPVYVNFRLPLQPRRLPGSNVDVRYWDPNSGSYAKKRNRWGNWVDERVVAKVGPNSQFASALIPHFSILVVMKGPSLAEPQRNPELYPDRNPLPTQRGGLPHIPEKMPKKDYEEPPYLPKDRPRGDERSRGEEPFIPEKKYSDEPGI